MVKAIGNELILQKSFLQGEEIQTIYFGGGTPSLLAVHELHEILETIFKIHNVNSNTEITLEANPDDLTPEKIKGFKNSGINRLSIGIQSFQDDLLKFLNRTHNSHSGISAYQQARDGGINNISIDLIYAIPGLEDHRWKKDIQQAIALEPEHISCYSLTIEEKTVFGKWASSGKLNPVDDEISARQFEMVMNMLEEGGYLHYEISNFAKPDYYSRHNSSYWKQENYLGIGPSAHSFNTTSRQFNVRNNHLYLKAIQSGTVPAEIEILTRENKINEYVLTTLRTHQGIDLSRITMDYQYDLLSNNSVYIHELLDKGLANLGQNKLTLTRKGKLLADKIASDLFVQEA